MVDPWVLLWTLNYLQLVNYTVCEHPSKWFDSDVSSEGYFNVAVNKNILHNCALLTWGNSLWKALFCSSMAVSLRIKLAPWRHGLMSFVWRYLSGLHRTLTSLNTFGMNWKADDDPDPLVPHDLINATLVKWLQILKYTLQNPMVCAK